MSYETNTNTLGVFTSTGVTGYKGIRVTFLHLNTLQKVTLIPLYPVTPALVNTPIMVHEYVFCVEVFYKLNRNFYLIHRFRDKIFHS